jgi:hypothetical protein
MVSVVAMTLPMVGCGSLERNCGACCNVETRGVAAPAWEGGK